MIVCVPVGADGALDPRWGRASRVAVATVEEGAVSSWHELDVAWDQLHQAGSERAHHARVARFLRDQQVDAVVAHHMGDGMQRMLQTMHLTVVLGASGRARDAVLSACPG